MVKHFLLSQFTIKLRENIAGIKNQLVRQLNQTTSNNSKFLVIEHGKMDRNKGTMQLHTDVESFLRRTLKRGHFTDLTF